MKNRKIKSKKTIAMIGFYLLIIISGLIQSCCEIEYKIVSAGSMEAWEMGEDFKPSYIDTIQGEFHLDIYFEAERIANLDLSLINTSYATTCNEVCVNSINESSIELSLSKSFIYNDNIINAGKNILTLDTIDVLSKGEDNHIEILFTDNFFSESSFKNGEYVFTLNVSTSDNIIIKSNITLNINIE